ncbi:MAG: ParB/RepB/Spo0J family partition protein, partial [Jatrophihabitantaceae bacterium]
MTTATEPTAETTEQPAGELLHLDPTTLLLDGNIRASADLDKDFLASIRERGVLVPIVAVRTADGPYRVRYGQRRTRAAIKTGRSTVPVVVIGDERDGDQASIERIVTQVHENEYRAGLTVADKAAAVEQLAAFGLSAAQIHKQVKGSRGEVDLALAVAGSELAKRAAARWDFLTLEQSATLADFENEPETIKVLVAAAKEGVFEHAAQRAYDARAEAEQLAAITERLTKAGVPIIDNPGHSHRTIRPLDYLRGSKPGTGITRATHAKCPGHAAYIIT